MKHKPTGNNRWKLCTMLLCAFLLMGSGSAQATTLPKPVKILAIGNSFSEDAVEQNLHELAKAAGIPTVIGNVLIGGCSLERHVKNARNNASDYAYRKIGVDGKKVRAEKTSLEKALADEDWDYVSLQQASPLSGMYQTYEASLPELIAYVKARLPKKTKLMLHQTWAYSADSKHGGFMKYDRDQLKMYHAIVNAVKKAGKQYKIKIIIPTGTAVQNARTSFVGDHMTKDGHHLDMKIGRYTAACTWFERIFKRNVVGNSYIPDGMNEAERKVAQKAAHLAVKHPNRITDLGDLKQ